MLAFFIVLVVRLFTLGERVSIMKQYESKEELVEAIKNKYDLYSNEFATIPNELKNKRYDDVDKSPSENVSYQLGWTSLLLQWEKEEKNGQKVHTPSDGYKWNNLGGLYESFYALYGDLSLEEQLNLLKKNVDAICEWVYSLTDDELFLPEQRDWATTKAKWPIYKWVHINTVAPFTNFRTKIRKWKKINASLQ